MTKYNKKFKYIKFSIYFPIITKNNIILFIYNKLINRSNNMITIFNFIFQNLIILLLNIFNLRFCTFLIIIQNCENSLYRIRIILHSSMITMIIISIIFIITITIYTNIIISGNFILLLGILVIKNLIILFGQRTKFNKFNWKFIFFFRKQISPS